MVSHNKVFDHYHEIVRFLKIAKNLFKKLAPPYRLTYLKKLYQNEIYYSPITLNFILVKCIPSFSMADEYKQTEQLGKPVLLQQLQKLVGYFPTFAFGGIAVLLSKNIMLK